MLDIEPPVGGLVPLRRFGAALTARRTRRRTTLTALSRRSGGWWSPDELMGIEQGSAVLDDISTVAVSRLYGLVGRTLPTADDVEVLLDRSTASDIVDTESVEGRGFTEFAIRRVDALASLLGVDLARRPDMVEVVAGAVTAEPAQVIEVQRRSRLDDEVRDGLVDTLSRRVVVPEVGVLVTDTDAGALVLVERRRTGRNRSSSHPSLPSAGALTRFVPADARS